MTDTTGKAAGGIARREALSPKVRKAIAQKAAAARWSGEVRQATHGSDDHPLRIGDIQIPCFVLEDETRVLSQRGLQSGVGFSTSGGSRGTNRMALFIESLADKGVDCRDLAMRIRKPILFRPPNGGFLAYGYEATILADICDAVLAARKKGDVLTPQQAKIAEQCELLVRGFARIGVVALVDEATGFQRDRAKDALAKILEAFVAKELQPYLTTFPSDYYEQLFRLRGLEYPRDSVKRPRYFGTLTNDIVYKRLAPGVLEKLKIVTPKDDAGRHKHKLFQRLTSNIGYPKLREHLGGIVATMKLSTNYHDFIEKLDRISPRFNETLQLPFDDYKMEADDGKGL
jgi:hypothetical protein